MRHLRAVLLLAWGFAASFGAFADIVTDANTLLLDAIRNDDTGAPLAARNLAILHCAIYDAFNGIQQSWESYFVHEAGPTNASAPAAAAAAAHEVLSYLYPSEQATFDLSLSNQLAQIPGGPGRDAGVQYGKSVAGQILNWRDSDGASTTVPYIPEFDPGAWRRTPPFFRPPDFPQWPYVTPFAMTNGAQFRPGGPPALDSQAWADGFNETKTLGASSSAVRTADQSAIAKFWSDFSYTVTPPGHWNWIAQQTAASRSNSLSDNVRMFALLNIAMADAGIAAWDAKYIYNFWRPVTAIPLADIDGNPATLSDTNWTPFLTTPSFPEYPSGHSTFSGAASIILSNYFGTDSVPFTIGSDGLPGAFRSYSSFHDTAEECGISRIYAGIHYIFSDRDGLAAGRAIGSYVFSGFLRTLPIVPALGIPSLTAGGQIQIQVSGQTGAYYSIESSTDLSAWSAVATNAAPFTYSESVSPGDSRRFYRARLAQTPQ